MGSPDSLSSRPLSLTCPHSNIADGGRWPPKCPSLPPPPPVVYDDDGDGGGGRRSRSRSRACITSCSLGSASSRLSIDRLCPRGPHGVSAFVQTRASPPVLVSNMAPVGGHVASPPPQRCCTTTDATRTVSAHSTTARDIWCSHESVSLSLSLSASHSHRLCLYLFLHSPLQRRLKYLHDQIERYCAESLDYLWSNAGKIGRRGERNTRVVIAGIFRTRCSKIRERKIAALHWIRAGDSSSFGRYKLFNPGSQAHVEDHSSFLFLSLPVVLSYM